MINISKGVLKTNQKPKDYVKFIYTYSNAMKVERKNSRHLKNSSGAKYSRDSNGPVFSKCNDRDVLSEWQIVMRMPIRVEKGCLCM